MGFVSLYEDIWDRWAESKPVTDSPKIYPAEYSRLNRTPRLVRRNTRLPAKAKKSSHILEKELQRKIEKANDIETLSKLLREAPRNSTCYNEALEKICLLRYPEYKQPPPYKQKWNYSFPKDSPPGKRILQRRSKLKWRSLKKR